MRPTPTEQLAAARRILGDLVAPHVAGEYPAALLAGVIDALGVLERGWEDVPGFLVRDTARLRDLLAGHGSSDAELAADIAEFLAVPAADATDLRVLSAHHERGRGLLVRAVPALATSDGALHRYFDDHIREFPLRPAPRVPAAAPQNSVPPNTAPDAKGS